MLWWIGVALAAVPDDIDLEAVELWEDNADRMLDGPSGCWEMVGVASWNWQAGRFGENRGSAAFVGRLKEGVWGDLHVESLGEWSRRGRGELQKVYSDKQRFAPLIGQVNEQDMGRSRGADEVEESEDRPDNILRGAIDEISGEASTSYADWDDASSSVILRRDIPIGKQARAPIAEVTIGFPDGGTVPVRWDVIFPETFRLPRFPNPKVRDAEVHLRGHAHKGEVFPLMETFSFEASTLGFRVQGAQTITYKKARPCSQKEAPAATGINTVN